MVQCCIDIWFVSIIAKIIFITSFIIFLRCTLKVRYFICWCGVSTTFLRTHDILVIEQKQWEWSTQWFDFWLRCTQTFWLCMVVGLSVFINAMPIFLFHLLLFVNNIYCLAGLFVCSFRYIYSCSCRIFYSSFSSCYCCCCCLCHRWRGIINHVSVYNCLFCLCGRWHYIFVFCACTSSSVCGFLLIILTINIKHFCRICITNNLDCMTVHLR